MRGIGRQIALALGLLVMAGAAVAQGVIDVPTQDKAMAAAIEKAKATLPKFFERLAKPQAGDDGFAVKIRYARSRSSADGEHI